MDDHKNFAYGTVLTPPVPALTGLTLTLNAGQGALMPTPPFNATVWPAGVQPLASSAEIVRVTAIVVDDLTIVRAQEGSTGRSILAGDQFAATITDKILDDLGAWSPTIVIDSGQVGIGIVPTELFHVAGAVADDPVVRLEGPLTGTTAGNPPSTMVLESAAVIDSTSAFAANANGYFLTAVQNTVNPADVWGVYSRMIDNTALANILRGIDTDIASVGNAAKTVFGIAGTASVQSTVANEVYGLNYEVINSGILASGVQVTIGALISATSQNVDGGTAEVTGIDVTADGTVVSGVITTIGVLIRNGVSSTAGTSKKTGLHVEAMTGADTNYAAIFAGGNVGIGTVAPAYLLHLEQNLAGNVRCTFSNPDTGVSSTAGFRLESGAGIGVIWTQGANTNYGGANSTNIYVVGANPLALLTNDLVRLLIGGDGLITLGSGQLAFPATQNPSADVNTLDDYAERTWTPILISSGGGAPTYTAQQGVYVKVGQLVFINGRIVLATLGTLAAGSLTVSLPLTGGGLFVPGAIEIVSFSGLATACIRLPGQVITSSATFQINKVTGAATTNPSANLLVADITAGLDFFFAGVYQASA